MNDGTHHWSIVQVLDCVFCSSSAGEQNPGQAQMLPGLWMKQYFHLLHLTKLGTHFCQKGLLDVIIKSGEGHLLEGYGAHKKFIKLW